MFTVGQKVWLRDASRAGIVLECVGGRVYIEQENGAELDFAAAELTATPPSGVAAAPPRLRGTPDKRPATAAATTRVLTARDITPAHARLLAAIPVRTLQAVAAIFERRPGAGRFSALDTAGKLNVIAEITAVPYATLQHYSDSPGELGLLMGKGLADSSRGR